MIVLLRPGPMERASLLEDCRGAAEAYVRRLVQREMPSAELVEGIINTGGLLREGRPDDFFLHVQLYSRVGAMRLRVELKYDDQSHEFAVLPEGAYLVEDLGLASSEWIGWFLDSARCPSCAIFPDMTDEYLSCECCGYADYRDDTPEGARARFMSQADAAELLAAVQEIAFQVRTSQDPSRRRYWIHRLQQMASDVRSALRPSPWESER